MSIKYYKRKFLNKTKGIAAIEVTGNFNERFNQWAEMDIKISDCNRSINLSYLAYTKKDVKDAIDKFNILISEITSARDWFEEVTSKIEFKKRDKFGTLKGHLFEGEEDE